MNMASLGFILLAMSVLTLYQQRMQITFDKQDQMAQDYSIVITNPSDGMPQNQMNGRNSLKVDLEVI